MLRTISQVSQCCSKTVAAGIVPRRLCRWQHMQCCFRQDMISGHRDRPEGKSSIRSFTYPDSIRSCRRHKWICIEQNRSYLTEVDRNDEIPESESKLVPGPDESEMNAESSALEQFDDKPSGDLHPLSELDISSVQPVLPSKSYNLAMYVNKSVTLRNLVNLGVNLVELEKDPELASLITRMDWETQVAPYVTFLHRIGVNADDLGNVITKCPAILTEDFDDLGVRINYLSSKRFPLDGIARIITVTPSFICRSTLEIDKQLGFLQRKFHLSGNQLREVVIRHPKLSIESQHRIDVRILNLKDIMGFTEIQRKQILLEWPKVYTSGVTNVEATFDYLFNVMGLTHKEILQWPAILTTRKGRIEKRHKFLQLIGQDQFDPKKENFISMKALVVGTDVEFCNNVAKVPIQEYNNFLKTL